MLTSIALLVWFVVLQDSMFKLSIILLLSSFLQNENIVSYMFCILSFVLGHTKNLFSAFTKTLAMIEICIYLQLVILSKSFLFCSCKSYTFVPFFVLSALKKLLLNLYPPVVEIKLVVSNGTF